MNWDLGGITVEQQDDPNYSNETCLFLMAKRIATIASKTISTNANDQYSLDENFTIC